MSDGLLTNTTGVLDNVRDIEIIPTFNAPSELNFRCYKVPIKTKSDNELPDNLQRVEYIQSSGTQYILTPVTNVCDGTFYIDFQMTETPSSGFPTIWGAMSSSGGYKVVFGSGNQKLYNQLGDGTGFVNTIDKDLNRHEVTVTTNGDNVSADIDGSTYNTTYVVTTDTDYALTMFARNRYDGIGNFAKVRIYSAWHKNSSGEYDFYVVPARTKTSTPEYGLYDVVHGQFLSNLGSGDFIGGDDVSMLDYLDESRLEAAKHQLSLYKSLLNRKLIYADGIGFFVITDFTNGYENKVSYKDIKAESCEVELRKTGLPYIADGTYKFYTGDPDSPGMIEMLVSTSPLWTIGTIDAVVQNRYRTFEEVDFSKNILGFMLEDLQDAYECLFVFDIQDRVINIYDQSNYVRETNIHITKDDLITSMNIEESSDDLYTALRVTGDEDLNINAVNPLGTGVIYNFSYYLDWMTPALKAKVITWQDLVDSYKDTYYNLQLSRYSNITSRNLLDAELDKINTQLTMYTRCRENIVASASDDDIAAYNAVITSVGGEPIPETSKYLWVMYADDNIGTNMSADPYGKDYMGLAWDKSTQVAGVDASDYSWGTFRNGEVFSRTVDGETKYTWVVYGDSVISGMSDSPDNKVYIGVAIDKDDSTKSSDYLSYSWSLIDSGGIGINELLSTIISLIDVATTEYDSVSTQRATIQAAIDLQDAQAAAIHAAVNIQDYFTSSEMDELSNYIIEGTYTDEFITVTENMTDSDRFAQMKTLYDRSIIQLEKISQPTQEYKLDTQNFIFVKDFLPWTEQLETGCLINVEVDEDDVAALFLTSFEVNYEDKSLSLTFGNRYNRFDPKALFEKVLGNVSKSANTLSYIKDTIYPIKSGEFDEMKEALDSSRTLTKNSVLSSDNEQVIIDDTGYTGRRILPDGTVDPKQIKINGRNIVFTDDFWETCKTAIGELILGDGTSAYGVNAEVLLGNLIVGQELHIVNDQGDDMFQVKADEVISIVTRDVADNYYSRPEVDQQTAAIQTSIAQTADGIRIDFTGLAQEINDVAASADARFTSLQSYIQMEGGAVTLGEVGNEVTLKVENDRIGIYVNNVEMTYWTATDFVAPITLTIPTGGRLNMGQFAFIPRANGSLDFTWVGA